MTVITDFILNNRAPEAVTVPSSAEELAATLREASGSGHAVVPWGGGTRQHLTEPPVRYNLAVATSGLGRVLAYHPEDLVITVEAGVTLAAVQALLADHGQWLPWDPPQPERATIGGLLASGAAGPLRLGYGAPRDWTLGMRVALGDGRLVKSGGRVVKNVAGYDTHKLHLGAYGTLGVIVEVTLKVQPLPQAQGTLLAAYTDHRLPAPAVAQLMASPLQPIAVATLNREASLALPTLNPLRESQAAPIVLARYAGTAAAVSRQIREATRRCVEVGARTVELCENDGVSIWSSVADFTAPARNGSLLLRSAAPSAEFGPIAGVLEQIAIQSGWRPAQLGIAGVGLVYSRWSVPGVPLDAVVQALRDVRERMQTLGGYLVLEELPAAIRCDRWGPPPVGIDLMRALRAAWDPAGILNPGRFMPATIR